MIFPLNIRSIISTGLPPVFRAINIGKTFFYIFFHFSQFNVHSIVTISKNEQDFTIVNIGRRLVNQTSDK